MNPTQAPLCKTASIQRDAELNDAPDTGLRHVQFMTWVVARRIGASATHGETEFLEGVKLDFTLKADWNLLNSGAIKSEGSHQTTSTFTFSIIIQRLPLVVLPREKLLGLIRSDAKIR